MTIDMKDAKNNVGIVKVYKLESKNIAYNYKRARQVKNINTKTFKL